MEGADGSAVLAAARGRWPGLPVVAVSATTHETLALGHDGYDASLLKPISLVELRHVLGRLLHLSVNPVRSEPAQAAPQAPRLSDVERDQVQRLLDSGAISDLMDWARTVQAGDPAFKTSPTRSGIWPAWATWRRSASYARRRAGSDRNHSHPWISLDPSRWIEAPFRPPCGW